jgi:hypothetical protein
MSREELMLWIKDVAAGLGLIAFIAGSFALASAAHAAQLLH